MITIRTIDMKELDNTMITIEDLSMMLRQDKLMIAKKINIAKLQAVAMLKTGKPGRPKRLFDRSEINELFDISKSAAPSTNNVWAQNENNQANSMA